MIIFKIDDYIKNTRKVYPINVGVLALWCHSNIIILQICKRYYNLYNNKMPPSQQPSKAAHEEGVLHCSKKVSKHLDGI